MLSEWEKMRRNTKIGMFACRTTSLLTWPITDRTCECPIYIKSRMKKKERKRGNIRGPVQQTYEANYFCLSNWPLIWQRADIQPTAAVDRLDENWPSHSKGQFDRLAAQQSSTNGGWPRPLSSVMAATSTPCMYVCLEHGLTLTQCLEFVANRDRWAEWPKPKL